MLRKRVTSFKYAIEGISTGLKDQPNIRIHLISAVLAIALGVYLHIHFYEWLIILLTISAVLSVEFLNTAVEEIVDSFTSEEHPSAKKAKDVAAAAVLTTSITALIIGIAIYLPYILVLLYGN
jgi:diacylglycerol kinase